MTNKPKGSEVLSCVRPLVRTDSGRVYPLSAEDNYQDQLKILQRTGEFIDVDGQRASIIRCGKCIGCQTDKAKEWANRLVMESSLWSENWFITLTFDDEHLFDMCGPQKSLKVEHIQDFMKKLRYELSEKRLNPETGRMKRYYHNVRFFACGEYGDEKNHTGRPHYHLILFNLHLPVDGLHWLKQTKQGNDLYSSDLIAKCWPYGFNTCGSVTFESCGYVARYTMKKVFGNQGKEFYEKTNRKQPFLVMSRRPGIGHDFMVEHDWTNEPNILVSDGETSHMVPVPQYMERYLKKTDPFLADERAKIKRRLAFETMQVRGMQTNKTRSEQASTEEKVLSDRTKVLTNRLDL